MREVFKGATTTVVERNAGSSMGLVAQVYRHPQCLVKHRWEHTTVSYRLTSVVLPPPSFLVTPCLPLLERRI